MKNILDLEEVLPQSELSSGVTAFIFDYLSKKISGEEVDRVLAMEQKQAKQYLDAYKGVA